NGTGWIAVALVIFANWNPLIAIFGSFFFGMLQELTVRKGNLVEEFPGLSFLNDIPDDFYNLLPFAFTALVLILAGVLKRKNAEPSGLGLNYFREER
ncbi:MAG TPA: ABC transporter permease, partial [Clostridiales bacterium]|nr:ABC transporter permease [Clostridiales bacterium]